MCVIVHMDTEVPTDSIFKQMADHNTHGAGLAWIDKERVFWKKGLELEEFLKTLRVLEKRDVMRNGPIIGHFRISTVGGTVPELCHPFPIENDVPLALHGSTDRGVLFHNGHWGPWAEYLFQGALSVGMELPKGKWSDSRALAWFVSRIGDLGIEGVRNFAPDRACILRPDGSTVWGNWVEPKDKGYSYSNDNWERKGWTGGGNRSGGGSVSSGKSDWPRPGADRGPGPSWVDTKGQVDSAGVGGAAGKPGIQASSGEVSGGSPTGDGGFWTEEGILYPASDGLVSELMLQLRRMRREVQELQR